MEFIFIIAVVILIIWLITSPRSNSNKKKPKVLGSVDLSRLNLQQSVWYLGKAEPMWCGYSP
jgi:hypothetical protein